MSENSTALLDRPTAVNSSELQLDSPTATLLERASLTGAMPTTTPGVPGAATLAKAAPLPPAAEAESFGDS